MAGTHSSGKTTLARRIEMELRATGLTVTRTGGLAKRAATLGFPKMTRHTLASTEWIITAGAAAVLEAELTADVVIVDRTAHDAIAYLRAAHQRRIEPLKGKDLNRLRTLANLHTRPAFYLATILNPALPSPPTRGRTRTGRTTGSERLWTGSSTRPWRSRTSPTCEYPATTTPPPSRPPSGQSSKRR
ncbi:hypothetical protein ACFQ0M_47870 [Kitasatospora aburaviensis]